MSDRVNVSSAFKGYEEWVWVPGDDDVETRGGEEPFDWKVAVDVLKKVHGNNSDRETS